MKKNKTFQYNTLIPNNVVIIKKNDNLIITGPLGSTKINLKKIDPTGMGAICIQHKNLLFFTHSKAFYGLFTSLLKNKIYGITRGFLVYLRIVGIGYRANIQTQSIIFKLGFSHDVTFKLPESIRAFLLEPTLICLYGIDKNQVTQIAAKIKQLRLPSIYKGKGIRLSDEILEIKQGKRK